MTAGRALVALACVLAPATGGAQALFRSDAPLEVTLTTNLRDLMRERDSTNLRWFGAEMTYRDETGTEVRVPVELRARGHFRRQSANCTFPPLFLRAERAVRDSSILRGNPRLKIVTPCRPAADEYRQYILTEYLVYRTYALMDSIHHRTRLANITYQDSANRVRPIAVTAFFLEMAEEVGDEHGLEFVETQGATWDYVEADPMNTIALFQYWIGNTDWSVSALHNIELFQVSDQMFRPIAYDFDWTGVVNPRYAVPNPILPIGSVRQRLHRGPCRSAADWEPTLAKFRAQRAAVDSVWAAPLAGQNARTLAAAKRYLDQLWPILDDPRQFKRAILDECRPLGN